MFKKTKKIIAYFLLLAMMGAFLPDVALAAGGSADFENNTFTPNPDVDFPVKINGDIFRNNLADFDPFDMISVTLEYDPTVITFIDALPGDSMIQYYEDELLSIPTTTPTIYSGASIGTTTNMGLGEEVYITFSPWATSSDILASELVTVNFHSAVGGGSTNIIMKLLEISYTSGGGGYELGTTDGPATVTISIPDTNAPIRSNASPSGVLPDGTATTTISLTTDENATCRYATSSGIAYASMTNNFAVSATTSHTVVVDNLSDGGSYDYYIRCIDGSTNANTDDYQISFTVDAAATPPVISNGAPSGVLASSTGSVYLSVTTNENATCKYSDIPGVAYASQAHTFITTGTTTHSSSISGILDGQTYTKYVRCLDGSGNANSSDYVISFSVATGTAPILSNLSPDGNILSSEATSTVISLNTDKNAECRYATSSGISFWSMPNFFASTTNIVHSTPINGLTSGTSYDFYIRCADVPYGNVSDEIVSSFSTAVAPDISAPVRSNASPSGALSAGTTQVTMSLTTDENATCHYASVAGTAYASSTAFSTTGSTTHSVLISGLANGTAYNRYVRCMDGEGNINNDDYIISFSVSSPVVSSGGGGGGGGSIVVSDTTAPVRSGGAPMIILPSGTEQVLMSLITNENATCRYATSSGVVYSNMLSNFTKTGTTSHSVLLDNLTSGGFYNYYIRCLDVKNNANIDDYIISFSVATPEVEKATSTTGVITTGNEEMILVESLIGANSELVNLVTKQETVVILDQNNFIDLNDIEKKLYSNLIKKSPKELVLEQKYQLAYFIKYGTPTTKKMGAGERAGVVSSYLSVFKKMPYAENEWQDVIKIANGRWPTERNQTAENSAKVDIFKKIYKRNFNANNVNDNSAVAIITYGLRPALRNINSEMAAIKSFKAIYKYSPVSAQDWDIVRAIAYSGAKR